MTYHSVIARLIVWLLLLTPAMPKIKISAGIYIYPVELCLLIYFMFVTINLPRGLLRIKAARYLLIFWIIIFASSLVNMFFYPDLIGLAKVIKGMIYVPVIYIGAVHGPKILGKMLYLGVSAELINLCYYFLFSVRKYGFDIWNPKSLLSGFSNKYVDLSTFSLQLIPHQGSHGIWGSYAVLLMAICLYIYKNKGVSLTTVLFVMVVSVINILFTVSRAALLVFFTFAGLVFLLGQKKIICRFKITRLDLAIFVVVIIVLVMAFATSGFLSQHIPLIKKIHYTKSAMEEAGGESNIILRIGAWQAGLFGMLNDPIKILIGCGYNRESVKILIESGAHHKDIQRFVGLPESLFMLAFEFGGIFALVALLLFLGKAISYGFNCRHDPWLKLFSLYIVALLPSNLLSGGSIIADLLYGQLLLIVGIMYNVKQSVLTSKKVAENPIIMA